VVATTQGNSRLRPVARVRGGGSHSLDNR
jgi:hypothetical protein